MNGLNINIGGGAFTTTMLGGGIALLIASGFINKSSPDMSGNLYASGWLLIIISFVLYIVRTWMRYWLSTQKNR